MLLTRITPNVEKTPQNQPHVPLMQSLQKIFEQQISVIEQVKLNAGPHSRLHLILLVTVLTGIKSTSGYPPFVQFLLQSSNLL